MTDILFELQQKVAMKSALEAKLRELQNQRREYDREVISLRVAFRKEQEDVEKLEGRSLANYFFQVVGKLDEKLDQERREAYAAKVKLDAAERELAGIESDITEIQTQLNEIRVAEASKIALYSVADYTWNMEKYDSNASWEHAIRDLMPLHAEYLKTFATHNSDLGKNGHNFHREESVALQPALTALLKGYQENGKIDDDAYRQVSEECDKIILAADMLLASGNENRPLINEMRPWLDQFKLVGEYGKTVLEMLRQQPQKEAFAQSHAHAQALQTLMTDNDARYPQGVKSGS